MYSFKYDYCEGAHPKILEALIKNNSTQMDGYGDDLHTLNAKHYIKAEAKREDIGVYLLSGGTQTNLTAICAMLRPHEAVIAPDTGHINVHESGAIEATGHKVIAVPTADGKLTAEAVDKIYNEHTDCHMVKPKMLYISNSTEIGSIYSKTELTKLSEFCRTKGMYLYLDGARLGSALMSKDNDLLVADLADLCDAFYIGATKNGGLIGEALVVCNPQIDEDLLYIIKQRGGLLAKGRVLGVQFEELFKDGLYYELAAHANQMAHKMAAAFEVHGYTFLTKPQTNQIFPVINKSLIEKLEKKYSFYVWKEVTQDMAAIRLVTSWATEERIVDEFIKDLS